MAPVPLETRRGQIRWPAYVPVTTFGGRYPLDNLVRPYLPRLAQAIMVSHFYAQTLKEQDAGIDLPRMIDSGGFACCFEGAKVTLSGSLATLEYSREGEETQLHPGQVLEFQEQYADVAFSLDFPIPPGFDREIAQLRLDATIANAKWALENKRSRTLHLFGCVQGWDADSFRACAQAYEGLPFAGIAIGGLVPRSQDEETVLAIVDAVRSVTPESKPIHVLGLGKPSLVEKLFKRGVTSVDSSSYVKLAADGRSWADASFHLKDAAPIERLHLALRNLAYATGWGMPLAFSRFMRNSPVPMR